MTYATRYSITQYDLRDTLQYNSVRLMRHATA